MSNRKGVLRTPFLFDNLRNLSDGSSRSNLPRPGRYHVHAHLAEADGHHEAGQRQTRFQRSICHGGGLAVGQHSDGASHAVQHNAVGGVAGLVVTFDGLGEHKVSRRAGDGVRRRVFWPSV